MGYRLIKGFSEFLVVEFQQKAKSLYDIIIDRWRQFTVLRVLSRHRIAVPVAGLKPLPCGEFCLHLLISMIYTTFSVSIYQPYTIVTLARRRHSKSGIF